MSRRSGVDFIVMLKQARRVARHPWVWRKLIALQGEKWLFDWLRPVDGRAGKIRQVSFRITDLCNLRCATCGQWGEKGFLHGRSLGQLRREEVSPGRYADLLDDLVRCGNRPLVYFWGGEPMLYEGSVDLMERAARLGLPVSIATNGTRVAREAERLVRTPLFLLQVSIDGHCAELHDRLRPSVGGGSNFQDVESALDAVSQARGRHPGGLPLMVSLTVISRENIHHLVDIYEKFHRQVDLFVFYLSWWIDPDRASAHERDFSRRFGFTPSLHRGWLGSWKPTDYDALDRQFQELARRSRSLSAPPAVILPKVTGAAELERYYTHHECTFGFKECISIYQAVEIDSNGDMSPCRDYHDYTVGNVKNDTIDRLWNSPAYRRFRNSISKEGLMPVCSRCCGLMGY